jgi:hypothetical protein
MPLRDRDRNFFNYFECEDYWMSWSFTQGKLQQGRRFRDLARETEISTASRERDNAAGPAPFSTASRESQFESARPLQDFYRRLDREAR